MKKPKTIKLIEGKFKYRDAKDILMHIFSTKLNFHSMNNFSHKEHFGKEDPIAKKRIPALKKELAKLEKILKEAELKNQNLIIHSEIVVSFSED